MRKYYNNIPVIVLFLLPAVLIYLIFEIIPVFATFYFSFNDWSGASTAPLQYVGLDNYTYLFTDEEFIQSIKNVLWYVGWSVILQVGIGYAVALALFHVRRGLRFFKVAFFTPMVLSATAISLLWGFILFPNDTGVLNTILRVIGLGSWQHTWLTDPKTALGGILAVTTWSSVGYYMIIGFAALSGISEDILEASTLDGATTFKKIFYIMLPMVRESLKISVIMVITGVLKIFDMIFIMTPSGGPNGSTQVPALLMYNDCFKYNHYGIGSAIAVVIFILGIFLSVLSLRVMRSKTAE